MTKYAIRKRAKEAKVALKYANYFMDTWIEKEDLDDIDYIRFVQKPIGVEVIYCIKSDPLVFNTRLLIN